MNQINIIPKIIHDKFAARIIMDDYDIEKPIVITVVARRNDGEYNTQILTYPTSGVDYEGNVRMVFFDVARSHVCQITSVMRSRHIIPISRILICKPVMTIAYAGTIRRLI